MKITRVILLVIGLLGLFTGCFGLINGDAFTDQIMTLICGSSLIYGYFALHKKEKVDC